MNGGKKRIHEILKNCQLVELETKMLMLQGICDLYELITEIDEKFHPNSELEMNLYSEALINARMSLLN